MGSEKSVSLIIPVYNVEKYLDRCLTSVEKQNYAGLEVVIVNDGSTDGSKKIIDKYVDRNNNFTCYSIENRGLGGARNYGMSKASGEYIVFLDSDDYIADNCISALINKACEDESDIVVCNYDDVTEEGETIRSYTHKYSKNPTSLEEEPDILFNRMCAWGKLYKKELFTGMEFVAREWYEDMRLIPKLFLKADKISYVNQPLFFYVQRKGSIMNNSKAQRNLEIIDAFEELIAYFKEEGKYDQFRQELEYLVIEHISVAGITRVLLSNDKIRKNIVEKLQDYLNGFEDLYTNKYIKTLSKNKRIILFLNRKHLYFVTRLLMKIKNM